MQFQKLILILHLFFIFSNLSCDKKQPKESHPSEVRLNFSHFPSSLDPRHGTEVISNTLSFMLYEGLTHLEADGTVSLALATNITVSKNQKEYLFTLRPSFWSNGEPLTAYDFEASWKQVLSPFFNSFAAELLYPIKNAEKIKKNTCPVNELGVKAINSHTLKVELEHPTPYFLQLTSYPTYFPVPKAEGKAYVPPNPKQLITNGPFNLVSWKNKNEIRLKKNPYFWDEKEVKIKKLHIIHISDELTPLYLFEKNRLDWIGGYLSPLPLSSLADLKKLELLKQHRVFGIALCLFNVTSPTLSNLNIRKALSYAIDTKLFDDMLTQVAATSLIDSSFEKAPPSCITQKDRHIIANKYFELGLKDLGFSKQDFPTLTYSYISHEIQRNIALILQNQWKEVLDLNVELEASEYTAFYSKLKKGQFTLAQTSWASQCTDRMAFLTRFESKESSKNYGKWEHPSFKDLMKQYNRGSPEEREECIEKGKSILLQEVPMIPLYHFSLTYLQNPNLKNVTISPLGYPHFRKAYFDL